MTLRRSILVPVLAATAVVTACTSKDTSSSNASGDVGGTLIYAATGDAADLFPPLVNEAVGRLVQDQVFDRLAEIGPDMNTFGDKGFTPRLAKSWTWAPDSLSIAFAIDPRAKWHDGKPVQASDIRYSFNVFMDPKVASPAADVLHSIDSVSVKDSLTAVVWFKKRTPEQFYDIVYNLIPLPQHVYGAIPMDQIRTSEATRTLVGTGRFRFVKWEPKVRIELVADTANYRGRAKLDRVVVAIVGDPGAARTQMLAGAADFMENFPVDQVKTIDSSSIVRTMPVPNYGYVFLGMNPHARKDAKSAHPIFSDLRVRRAMAMAMDRVAMLQNVFGGQGRLAHGPFPMTVGSADSTLKLPAYDTTAAKALLDSAGWKPGPDGVRAKNGKRLQFGLVYPSSSPQRRQYSVLVQDQLRRIGAQVDIEGVDPPTFLAHTNGGDYDTYLAGYNVDPSISGAKQNWASTSFPPGGLNALLYSNKTVDAALDTASTTFDITRSKQAAARAYQAIINDVPAVFLYDIVLIDVVNKRFTTAATRPDGWWVNLADWSVPASKRIDRDKIGLGAPKS